MRRRRFLAAAGATTISTASARAADLDVVVIGAGISGQAAARGVLAAHRSVAVLEARERIGGRVHSDSSLGFIFDHGAPTLVPATHTAAIVLNGKELTREQYARFEALQSDFEVKIGQIARARPGADPAKQFFLTDPLEKLALAELLRRPPSFPPIVVSLDVRPDPHVKLGARVLRIDSTQSPVRVISPAGEYSARAVIVTVPVGVLGDIGFAPPLAAPRKSAIAAFSMAQFDKVAVAFSRKVIDAPADARILGLTQNGRVVQALLRPQGHEAAVVFFPGDEARALEAAGPSAAGATALSLLADLFGKEIRAAFAGARSTRWGEDRFAKGAWSVGPAALRAVLATPHPGNVLFAGEATTDGSLMGAYNSGLRAAKEALSALGHK
jgi:monoamine oxidase